MGIDDEPPDIRLLQDGIDARHIAALGEPDAFGVAAEARTVFVAADKDLRAHRLGNDLHERQEAVRGGASDDFDDAVLLELRECADDVAVDFLAVEAERFAECGVVVAGDLEHRGIACGSLEFHLGEGKTALEVAFGARDEERIAQHRANGGREREGDFERHLFGDHAPEHFQQRDVALCDGFKEPVLLEEFLVLGMPDPRQMGMEQNRERALVHTGGERDTPGGPLLQARRKSAPPTRP